jgi:L-aspartate oxidase
MKVKLLAADGDRVKKGAAVLRVEGPTAALLTAERTALNFLQRLSGIATLARRYADVVAGTGVRIVDTRKTTPGWRALEKYAVRCGGCFNHRSSLGEHVLIKDNHIAAAGSLTKAVRTLPRRRTRTPRRSRSRQDARRGARGAARRRGVILLDNMTPAGVRAAVAVIAGAAVVEVSGGVKFDTLRDYALPGVDVISIGALTHSAVGGGSQPDPARRSAVKCETIHTDCLVMGAGLAGSAYALHAARPAFKVELLSLGEPLVANSDWAQGGIIYDTTPDPASLARDIIEASDGTANPAAIEQLVREGPAAVKELLLDNLRWILRPRCRRRLDLTREGGHSRGASSTPRMPPATRSSPAWRRASTPHPRITRRSGWVAIDLLTLSHNSARPSRSLRAAHLLRRLRARHRTGEVRRHRGEEDHPRDRRPRAGFPAHDEPARQRRARRGDGLPRRRAPHRPRIRAVSPDGVRQAERPAFPRHRGTARRGRGARQRRGRRFMDAVHPRGSLAPRDVVARAIKQDLAASGEACVYLDLSAMKPEFIRERFPGHLRALPEGGRRHHARADPVVPAAHFSCGGVHTDLQGRTNVRHLNAIGETACTGLHGANRLASTSLLECLVGARARAPTPSEIAELRQSLRLPDPGLEWKSPAREADLMLVRQDCSRSAPRCGTTPASCARRASGRARRILLELREEIQSFYRDCRPRAT